MRRWIALGLCVAAAGCSGGPLKEIPLSEPPPIEEPAPVLPPAAPAPVAAAAPAPAPEPPSLAGAWRSTSAAGPGSAAVGRVVLVFDGEGGLSGAAFGPSGVTSLAGTYTDMDDAVQVDLGDGDVRLWVKELEPGRLVLRDGDQELRLAPLR